MFQVLGDPKNPANFSSSRIIASLNDGAKKAGVYSESAKKIVYSCIAEDHGYNPDALIVCYEIAFPDFVINKCGGRPVIGVSKDNAMFAIQGGYPANLVNYINLGVDTNIWKPVKKKYLLDKFVVLSFTESLCRSGLDRLVEGFGKAFMNQKGVSLYIKDRNSRSEFKDWLDLQANKYNIEIIYNNSHIETPEQEMEIFAHADCHFYLNRSTTWGMTVCQSMACGIPTVSPAYSGPREYILDKMTGLNCEYNLSQALYDIPYLESIGMRNFFFPLRISDTWCEPKLQSIIDCLLTLKEGHINKSISEGGIALARTLTWERAAVNLDNILKNL